MYGKGPSRRISMCFFFFYIHVTFYPVAESNLILTETFRVDFFLNTARARYPHLCWFLLQINVYRAPVECGLPILLNTFSNVI